MTDHPALEDLLSFRSGSLGSSGVDAVRAHLASCTICTRYFERMATRPTPALPGARLDPVRMRSMLEPLLRHQTQPAADRAAELVRALGRGSRELVEALLGGAAAAVTRALDGLRVEPVLVNVRGRSNAGRKSRRGPSAVEERTRTLSALAQALLEERSEGPKLAAAALAIESGDRAVARIAIDSLPTRAGDAWRLRAWYAAELGDEEKLERAMREFARRSPKDAGHIEKTLRHARPSAKLFLGRTVHSYVAAMLTRAAGSP